MTQNNDDKPQEASPTEEKPKSVEEVLVEFVKTHCKPGTGISATIKGSEIKVTVKFSKDADKLPTKFENLRVEVYQDFGKPLGKRCIIRDANGKVVGFQG